MKYIPYSFSKISTFKCPYRFKLRYIDKKYIDASKLVFDIGNYFHKYLENLFRNKEEFKPFMSKFITEENSNIVLETENKVKELKDKKFIKMLQYKARHSDLVIAEGKCKLDEYLENSPLTDKQSIFKGYIDLYMIENKEGIIVDWKSGKIPNKPDWKQTLYYSLWLIKKYKLDKVTAFFYYVQHDEYKKKVILKSHIDNIGTSLISSIDAIEKETEFNQYISPLCKYCEYFENECKLTDDQLLAII